MTSQSKKRSATDSGDDVQDAAPRTSLLNRAGQLWTRIGINWRTYQTMFKGALAPTIALAMFQAKAVADSYTTIGYLIGIAAVLSIVIAPRTKFLQTMIINILFSGLACCVALFAMFCSIRARIDAVGYRGPGTGGPGTSGMAATGAETAEYNSSASAVAGLWLFVEIYAISVIRAKNPSYTVPGILAAIFANISTVYAPQFSTFEQAANFAYRLLSAFYTGFAIATGVSLLVFPMTSRQVVFKDMAAYITSIRGAMSANLEYMHSLENNDMFTAQKIDTDNFSRSTEAENFKAKVRAVSAINGKMSADLPFAKREIAIGRLGPDNIQELFRLLRAITIPITGLSCMPDIFDLIAERRGWDRSCSVAEMTVDAATDENQRSRIEIVNEWHNLMQLLRQPFGQMTQVIDDGLEHVMLTMLFKKPSKSSAKDGDVEAKCTGPRPGDKEYTAFFKSQADNFAGTKQTMLRGWCRIHDIELPQDFFSNPAQKDFQAPAFMHDPHIMAGFNQSLRRQLFLCLYMEFLLVDIGRRTYELMLATDGLRDKLSKKRLVVPGSKRLRKWAISFFRTQQDTHGSDDRVTDGNTTTVFLGDAYKMKKDPEHLQPSNAWERFSDNFRLLSHFFSSPASAFGFRVACATMSIAVVSFLQPTQTFFTTERLFWAQIMVSISMSPTAGQSLRNFLLRIVGTVVALLASWVAFYIVDGQTAGVLVFMFVFLHAGSYVLIKYPQYTPVGMIGQVTIVLIIGYELQARKLGIEVATSNGQRYYPIYELGPIRLATVCSGLLVAWIWTVFPYPISEHNQMRKSLGQALYLLANYYSVMHETVNARLRASHTSLDWKEGPGRKLAKSRLKIYNKAGLTLDGLRAQSGFLKFDIPIGGKFPHKQYQKLVNDLQSMLNFMSLVSLASATFGELQESTGQEHGRQWLRTFRKLVGEAKITSQNLTTLLSLMSACVSAGHALPPYLRVPEAYLLEQKLDELDNDLLSIRHISEPGYASFAVMQVGSRCIIDDMKRVMAGIKELVGELDFSYHIVSTNKPSSEETLVHSNTQSRLMSTTAGKED